MSSSGNNDDPIVMDEAEEQKEEQEEEETMEVEAAEEEEPAFEEDMEEAVVAAAAAAAADDAVVAEEDAEDTVAAVVVVDESSLDAATDAIVADAADAPADPDEIENHRDESSTAAVAETDHNNNNNNNNNNPMDDAAEQAEEQPPAPAAETLVQEDAAAAAAAAAADNAAAQDDNVDEEEEEELVEVEEEEVALTPMERALQDAKALNGTLTIEDLERDHVATLAERDALQEQLMKSQEKYSAVWQELQAQKNETAKVVQLELQLSTSHVRIQTLQQETESWQERQARMQEDLDRSGQEMARLVQQNVELQTQLSNTEMTAKLHDSMAIPLLHEKERLQSQLDSTTQHANWLQQELTSKQAESLKQQQEARDRQLQLQLQWQVTHDEKEATEAREKALRDMEQRLQDKVNSLSKALLESKQEYANMVEESQKSLLQETKLTAVQRDHLARQEQRYNDLRLLMQSLQDAAAAAEAATNAEIQAARDEVQAHYAAMLQQQAAEFRAQLAHVRQDQDLSTLAVVPRITMAAGPTLRLTATAGQQPPTVMTYTQVCEQLDEQKALAINQGKRAELAELQMKRIEQEIAAQTPALMRQRKQYEMARQEILNANERLDEFMQEVDHARADCQDARRLAAEWKRKFDAKDTECKVVSQQVQAMLMSRSTGGGDGDGRIPTTVAQIQTQNQRLLFENRQLQDSVRELETKLNSDGLLRNQLEQAKAEINEMEEERKLQEASVKKIVQQRDLFRSLAHINSDNASDVEGGGDGLMEGQLYQRAQDLQKKNRELEQDVATIRDERDGLARDKEATGERLARYEERCADLTQTVSRLETELINARGEVGRAVAEAGHQTRTSEQLQQKLQGLQKSLDDMTKYKNELQRVNEDLVTRISNANDRASQAETEKSQAERNMRRAEADAEIARGAERRLAEENRQLRVDMTRSGSAFDAIRRIEDQLSAKNATELERLREDVQRLTQRLEDEAKKYTAESDNLKERNNEMEARIRDIESTKEKAQAQVIKVKEMLHKVESEKNAAVLKCETLESKLRAANKKLGIDGAGETTTTEEQAEIAIRAKVDTLTKHLEAAKAEVVALKESVELYKNLAKESEASLAQMTKLAEDQQSSRSKTGEEVKAHVESLKQQNVAKQELISELTKDLGSVREEREKAEAILRSDIAKLKAEVESSQKDLESVQAAAAADKHDLDALREEVKVAQNNYERELQQHSKARTSLRAALEQAQEDSRLRLAAQEELKAVKDEQTLQQETWQEERATMQKSSEILEKSVEDARAQNQMLHAQLESLGDQVEKSNAARLAAAESEEATTIAGSDGELNNLRKQLSELREIVKFVRSENLLIQTNLDTAKRSAERERASANVVKDRLEEARAELKSLRDEKNGANSANALAELTEKLKTTEEQVKLLGDSNKLLRKETQELQAALATAEQELDALKKSTEPAEKQRLEKEVEIASLKAEIDSLKRELDLWKGKVEKILSKFDQIDPGEHKQALQQVEDLKKEKEILEKWKVTTAAESTRIREIARALKQKNQQQKGLIDSQTAQIAKLVADKATSEQTSAAAKERDEFKEKVHKLEKDAEQIKIQLDGANGRNEKLRERLRQFNQLIRDLRASENSLKEQLSAAQEKAAAAAQKQQAVVSVGPLVSQAAIPVQKQPVATAAPTKKQPVVETKAPPAPLPSVPQEGFKFGPSEVSTTIAGAQAPAAPSSSVPVSTATEHSSSQGSLRAVASPFVPAVPSMQAQELPVPAVPAPAATTPAKRRMSGENKEMSLKEKLIERRRLATAELAEKKRVVAERLAQEKKRKLEVVAAQAIENEGGAKKSKTDEEEPTVKDTEQVTAETTEESADGGASQEAEPVETGEPEDVGRGDAEPVNAAPEMEGSGNDVVAAAALEQMDDGADTSGKGEDDAPAPKNPSSTVAINPFGAAVSAASPFGSGAPITFGQSSSFAGFGSIATSTTPATGGFGSAFGGGVVGFAAAAAADSSGTGFLNMKPPGSSTSPPSFSFGSSATITLPTPTITAPPPSPFAVFERSSSFGAPSALKTARPLFEEQQMAAPPLEEQQQPSDDTDDQQQQQQLEDIQEMEEEEVDEERHEV